MFRSHFPTRGACPKSQPRGSATLVSMMLMLVLTVLGLGLASSSLQALRLARGQQNASVAFNLAESGAERALRYLRVQSSPPPGTAAFDPFYGAVAMGNGSYQVTIDPYDNNATVYLKRYTIRAIGTYQNRRETIEMVARLGTFGAYAFFFDRWNPGLQITEQNEVEGAAHTNGAGGTTMKVRWDPNATQPIFNGLVTNVPTSITWTGPRAPVNEIELTKIFSEGAAGYRLGVSNIPLPTNTFIQRDAAWGSSSGFPTTTGVHIPTSGSALSAGIYIVGDVSKFQWSVTDGGNQKITIKQGTTTTDLVFDRAANSTTRTVTVGTGSPTTSSFTGTTNGAIYCTGHITDMSGTLADSAMNGSNLLERNAFTVTTDVQNQKNITVTGDILYTTQPNNSLPWDEPTNLRSAALGLVCNECKIADNAPTNFTIDAIMMAGGAGRTGKFWAPAYGTKSPRGRVELFGGCIANDAGATYTNTTGWVDDYRYDNRMRANPPPYFPTTGLYERLSWKRTVGTVMSAESLGQ